MNIVTTYFTVKRLAGSFFVGEPSLKFQRERQWEYLECLQRNLSHPAVRSVLLLVEGPASYHHFLENVVRRGTLQTAASFRPQDMQKLLPILYSPPRQPVYTDLFRLANQFLPGQLTMVCNADIHLSARNFTVTDVEKVFADYERRLPVSAGPPLHSSVTRKLALALTRHEMDNALVEAAPLITDYRGSHDAFVLRPPVPMSFLDSVSHQQNCYQAENIVIHELRCHGYEVFNPCLDLRVVHRHAADMRQWLPSVDPTRYAKAPPCRLSEVVVGRESPFSEEQV